VLTVYGIETI